MNSLSQKTCAASLDKADGWESASAAALREGMLPFIDGPAARRQDFPAAAARSSRQVVRTMPMSAARNKKAHGNCSAGSWLFSRESGQLPRGSHLVAFELESQLARFA